MPQFGRPSEDKYNGDGWTEDDNTTTDMWDEINETSASDTDYVRSALAPSNDAVVFTLTTLEDPISSSNHIIRWRRGKDASGGAEITETLQLRQSYINEGAQGTLIATGVTAGVVPETFTDTSYTLSGAEADAITNYGALFLRYVANTT